MSKYPVETADMDGVIAGVNYLLSGPQGTGQNYSGQSSMSIGSLSGNPRPPYISSVSPLTVSPISLSSSEMLDEYTFKFTFSSTQLSVPFNLGASIIVAGVTNPVFNQQYAPIGVIECTTSYVIARTDIPFTVVSPSTGGTVEFRVIYDETIDPFANNDYVGQVRTPLIATASVTSISDRVLVSGQLTVNFHYDCTSDSSLNMQLGLYRSKLINQGDQQNPKYVVEGFVPIFYQTYLFNYTTGDSGQQSETFVVAGYIDQAILPETIPLGLYEYTMAMDFYGTNNDLVSPIGITISEIDAGLGTIVAQVIKQ